MSLSRSPIWTHRSGAPINSVERRRLSSQRMLSFCSIGTRVGLTLRASAFVPLNFSRDQNFAAVSPSGKPSGVTARLACMSMPQIMCWLPTLLALPAARGLCEADLLRRGPLEREFRGVLQHQDRAVRRPYPQPRGREVTRQYLVFADILVRKEPVGRFCVRPVLECRRQGFPRPLTQS